MKNQNRIVGQLLAGVVKRLKAAGLPKTTLARALVAVTGENTTATNFRLTPAIRKQLFNLVKKNGPLVVTGRTSLKIFKYSRYNAMRVSSSANAKKHSPWKHSLAARRNSVVVTKNSSTASLIPA